MNSALQFILDLNRYNSGNQLRLGMARVRSVDGDPVYGTVTGQAMIVPASGEWDQDIVPAYYLGEYPPRPGGACWYASDGRDRLILGEVAPEGPPIAVLSRTSATAITTGAGSATFLPWETQTTDPWNMYDSTNTAIKIPVPGQYVISSAAEWAAGTVGYRAMNIYQNGTIVLRERREYSTTGVAQSVTTRPLQCSTGDLITVGVFHTQGANLNLNALNLSATYVGRRRTAGSGPEQLADGSFESTGTDGWDFTQTTAVYTLSTVTPQDGDYCLQAVHGAGSALTSIVYGPDKIPVVPGQSYNVTAYVRGSAAITASGSAGVVPFLLCAPDGLPDPTDSTSSTATSAATASVSTSWSQVAQVQTVPANCFTARVGLKLVTSAANTAFWDNLSITEKIN